MKEKEMPKKKNADEKNGEKKHKPVKKIKPLAERLMAVSAAVVISACTTTFNAKDSDAHDSSSDNRDTEATEVSGDVPPVDVPIDSIGDNPVDGVEDDGAVTCEPFSDSSTALIDVGMSADVGGISIRYEGMTGTDEGEYSVLCDGEVVAGDTIALSDSRVISVPEHSFDVEISVDMVRDSNTRVNITVTPY